MSAEMIAEHDIDLARIRDAARISAMSRDLVEYGLGWRWTPHRIVRAIRDPATNVVVARTRAGIAGFAIMRYKDDEAHLLLLAVDARQRRKHIGATLMAWLESTALTAGTGLIYLEARTSNASARAFYGRLGYREISSVRALYSNNEDGVRIAKDLWA